MSAVLKGVLRYFIFTGGVNLSTFEVVCAVVLFLGSEIYDLDLTFISVRFSE